ncbi:MAG: ferredoxin family protein [Burkholderiales bacterium]|nr:ferredoxin family protein [Burkholderiales bacterium]
MAIAINHHRCTGCRACYDECPADVFAWDAATDLPIVAYPDECWHCGICSMECDEKALIHTLPPQCWNDINKRYVANLGRMSQPKQAPGSAEEETGG